MTKIEGQRQRLDGSWTFSSEEWDAAWHWPVGSMVVFRDHVGVITKQNSTTVIVKWNEDGSSSKVAIGPALSRFCSFCLTTGHDVLACQNIDEETFVAAGGVL